MPGRMCSVCRNPLSDRNPNDTCGRHGRVRAVQSRGTAYISGIGTDVSPASLKPKLRQIDSEPIPVDTLHVPSFPHFSRESASRFLHWVDKDDITHKPRPGLALKEFPIITRMAQGNEASKFGKDLVGLVMPNGSIEEIEEYLPRESTDRVSMFLNSYGSRVAVANDKPCEVVLIDSEAIRWHLNNPDWR